MADAAAAAAAASPSLPPRPQHLPASPASHLAAPRHSAVKNRRSPRPRPDAMVRSPAAPTPTTGSPTAPNPTSISPAAPNPTPSSPVADLDEPKVTSELLRAIKIEKTNGPDLEEHKEPPKCKKRKQSRQSSGELHKEQEETNKVVKKPSTSKKKRKASEVEMCTNPPAALLGPLVVDIDKQAPPLKKKRLNKRDVATTQSLGSLPIDKDKQPSLASLPLDKDKQPSPGSLPVDKNKQSSQSKRLKLDILKWWEIHTPKYPVLAAIARDILAVSASTVPAEAAFSNAGRIITEHRSSLTPDTVETLMCLEDWLRAADRQKTEPTAGDHGGDQDDVGTT